MGFSLTEMFKHMGGVAWAVTITLLLMSILSIGIMIERWYTYSQATKQSRKYAPEVARLLKQGKIKEAIDVSNAFRSPRRAAISSGGTSSRTPLLSRYSTIAG